MSMSMSDQRQETTSVPRVKGFSSAVLFLSFFSTVWALVGIGGLNAINKTGLVIVIFLIGIALFLVGFSLSRAARRLPQRAAGQRQGKTRWFIIVFGAELLLILIAHIILSLVNRLDLFIPATMVIVGVHFFPLATLFRVKVYHLVGALFLVLVIITLLAVPQRLRLDGFQIAAWQAVLGLFAAIILWSTGLVLWFKGRRLLAHITQKHT